MCRSGESGGRALTSESAGPTARLDQRAGSLSGETRCCAALGVALEKRLHRDASGALGGVRAVVHDLLAIFANGREQAPSEPWVGDISARDFTAIVCWALAQAATIYQLEHRLARRRWSAHLWRTIFDAFSLPDLEEFEARRVRWPTRLQRIIAPHLFAALAGARRNRWTTRSPRRTAAAIDSVCYFLASCTSAGELDERVQSTIRGTPALKTRVVHDERAMPSSGLCGVAPAAPVSMGGVAVRESA
jgi:hypothetical protein